MNDQTFGRLAKGRPAYASLLDCLCWQYPSLSTRIAM